MPIPKRAQRAPRQPKQHQSTRPPITPDQLARAEDDALRQIATRVYSEYLSTIQAAWWRASEELYALDGDDGADPATSKYRAITVALSRDHAHFGERRRMIAEHESARRGEDLKRAARRILIERGASGYQVAALDDPSASSAALKDTAVRKAATRDRDNLRQEWQAELGKARRRLMRIDTSVVAELVPSARERCVAKIVDLERRLRDLDPSSER